MKVISAHFEKNQERILVFNNISAAIRHDMQIPGMIKQCLFPRLAKPGAQAEPISALYGSPARNKSSKAKQGHRLLVDYESLSVGELMGKQRRLMIGQIKQYSIFKEILDRNS